MPYILKLFILSTSVLAFVYLLWRIRRYFVKRTIANWAGEGVNLDLEPAEVGILLGALPGKILAAFLTWLETRGRIRIEESRPLSIRWLAGPPEGEVERTLADALEAGVTEEGLAEVLEALYRETNRSMAGFSGRATAANYRAFIDDQWGSELSGAVEGEGLEAWLVLRGSGRDWDRIVDDEAGARLRRAVKLSNHLEGHLFSEEFLFRHVAKAGEGFFRYRKELVPPRVTPRAYAPELQVATVWRPDDAPSDPAERDPDA